MATKPIALAALVLALAAFNPPARAAPDRSAPVHGASACARADSRQLGPRRFLAAVHCLHNAERRARRLDALAHNRSLARAARRHARDMVRRRYFSHSSPDGSEPLERARHAGYRGADLSVGENILYVVSGRRSTPREVVDQWMKSPPHRRNILRAQWEDVGFGAVRRAPTGAPGITLVANFGTRG